MIVVLDAFYDDRTVVGAVGLRRFTDPEPAVQWTWTGEQPAADYVPGEF